MKFTELQQDLLIGTLLGDGNLQTFSGNTWRYRAIHKKDHFPYIEHKYNVLKDICKSPPSYSSTFDLRTNKTYDRYCFNSLTHVNLQFYGNLFYIKENAKWVKKVPFNIHKYLTPRALAYWYMDNGSLKWKGHSNAVRICTDGFALSDVKRLQYALINNFHLEVTIVKQNDQFRLSINEKSYEILKPLIVPYLIPCMYYKFPDGQKGTYT